MKHTLPSIDKAVKEISRLPGIGRRTAQRLVLHMLVQSDGEDLDHLRQALLDLKEQVVICPVCFNLTEQEGNCEICQAPERDQRQICVIESYAEFLVLEQSGEYHGLYHILGGVIAPLDGIGPDSLHLEELEARVKKGVQEVIVATNPTVEGEATANYIARMLNPLGVNVTRLARGIPMGSNLDYIDSVTLTRSLASREKL
jgi:recombination protein RecR